MGQRPVLGKGLASLLPGATAATSAPISVTPPVAHPGMMGTGAVAAGPAEYNAGKIPGITFAMIDDLVANQYQPRRDFDDSALQELAASIKANGIIQPLVVRKGPYGYQLIAGERRLRAAKIAGLKQVPIVVRKSTDREALEIALVENIQRQDLNCIDEALAYLQMMQDFNLTQEEVAERTGKDRSTVANFVRLLRLPEAVIDDLKKGALSFGHGKALLGLEDQDSRLLARAKIIEQKMSVRATEALIDAMKKSVKNTDGSTQNSASTVEALTPVQSRIKNLSLEMTRQVGLKVEIKGSEKKGKFVLHYTNREELDRLISLMQTRS